MNILPMQNSPSPFPRTAQANAPSSSGSNSSSSASSASIGANDFLQLLVTELKNQDPTANNDPNEYINQLVQVNSLEQLIQINTDLGGNSSSAASSGSNAANHNSAGVVPPTAGAAASRTSGNLSASGTTTAASRVADALTKSSPAAVLLPGGTADGVLSSVANILHNRAQQLRPTTSNPVR